MTGNGIDDSVMTTTFNLVHHLKGHHHLEHDQGLLDGLRQGSLLDQCTNYTVGSQSGNLFTYNIETVNSIYSMFKPPLSTCS